MSKPPRESHVPDYQILYAKYIGIGGMVGMVILLVTYLLYMSGVLETFVPLKDLPSLWSLPSSEYLAATGQPDRWGWVTLFHYGDIMNYAGIVVLGCLTASAYLILIPVFARKKDWPYLVIVCLQIVILVLAASAILTGP